MNQFLIIDSVFYACGHECAGTHVCMHVCGGQKTTLGVCVPVLYCFCSYGSVIWFEIRYCSFSSIFSLQDCFDYPGSFIWPYEVLDFFSNPISAKNVVTFFDFTESVDYFPNISSDDPWNRFLLGLLGFSTCPLFESFILEVLTSLVKFMTSCFVFDVTLNFLILCSTKGLDFNEVTFFFHGLYFCVTSKKMLSDSRSWRFLVMFFSLRVL